MTPASATMTTNTITTISHTTRNLRPPNS
jgi:hypothetical protein